MLLCYVVQDTGSYDSCKYVQFDRYSVYTAVTVQESELSRVLVKNYRYNIDQCLLSTWNNFCDVLLSCFDTDDREPSIPVRTGTTIPYPQGVAHIPTLGCCPSLLWPT